MRDRLAAHVDRLREIAGIVTPVRLVARPSRPTPEATVTVAFDRPAPIRGSGSLRGGMLRIRVELGQDVAPVPSATEAVVRSYQYALLDRIGTELLAWHRHPASRVSTVREPHLHVSAALRPTLPNGEVSLAAFVRMLVGEFGVEPAMEDWRGRLGDD